MALAWRTWAVAHQEVYGVTCWIPKSHFLSHLPRTLEKLGFLTNSFALERKHKSVKRALQNRASLKEYERGLMDHITSQHRHDAKAPIVCDGLCSPKTPSAHLIKVLQATFNLQVPNDVQHSTKAYARGRAVCTRDVVVYEGSEGLAVGEVCFHLAVQTQAYTCISPWKTLDTRGNVRRCEVCDDTHVMVPTAAVVESCIFAAARVGEVSQVLMPRESCG